MQILQKRRETTTFCKRWTLFCRKWTSPMAVVRTFAAVLMRLSGLRLIQFLCHHSHPTPTAYIKNQRAYIHYHNRKSWSSTQAPPSSPTLRPRLSLFSDRRHPTLVGRCKVIRLLTRPHGNRLSKGGQYVHQTLLQTYKLASYTNLFRTFHALIGVISKKSRIFAIEIKIKTTLWVPYLSFRAS